MTREINGNKLKAKLKELGVSVKDAGEAISRETGCGPHYLQQAVTKQRINHAVSKALFLRYGINPEDYIQDGAVPEAAEDGPCAELRTAATRTPEGLREIIREAALDAMVQALADEGMRKAVGDMIYQSVRGAIINSARLINQGGGIANERAGGWEDHPDGWTDGV